MQAQLFLSHFLIPLRLISRLPTKALFRVSFCAATKPQRLLLPHRHRRPNSAQQSKTDPEPHAIVALGEFGDLAVVLARALNATADAHQSFFRSGGGRTIHPSGFEIVGVRTLMIPRSIMRELVNRPTDPRELYVLAAAILPTNSLSPEPPEIKLTWACGETPEAAVKRWQEAEKGLRGLGRGGKRAAIITSLLIPRSQMEWTLRFPPVSDD